MPNTNKQFYVGVLKVNNKGGNVEFFVCNDLPSENSYSHYRNVYGPFDSVPSAGEYILMLEKILSKTVF
jgi:hypothetical protein